MSKFVSGLLGAAALIVSVGAAQFAVGQNLQNNQVAAQVAYLEQSGVNRSGKSDMAQSAAREGGRFVTHVSALSDQSVAMRVLRSTERRDGDQREGKVGAVKPSSKRPVACEASASVLTDVAKLMESARCVT